MISIHEIRGSSLVFHRSVRLLLAGMEQVDAGDMTWGKLCRPCHSVAARIFGDRILKLFGGLELLRRELEHCRRQSYDLTESGVEFGPGGAE